VPENDDGLNSADPSEIAEETPRLPYRSPAAKGILRMVFLAGVFALVLCVSRPYPLLDGGATTIWLLALCLCAGVILFGTPRDAAIIARDVALAMLPWLLATALLANGAFDSSQEILHQTSVVRTVDGRRGSRLIVQSWRPGKPTESLYLNRFFLFGHRGFYFPGQPVTVSTRSGALGMPWVSKISR
jgi:hypothetical protein